jgi:hypothetical protein
VEYARRSSWPIHRLRLNVPFPTLRLVPLCPVCPEGPILTSAAQTQELQIFICQGCGSYLSVPTKHAAEKKTVQPGFSLGIW